MNKWLIFGVGAITGGVLTILILLLIGLSSQKNNGLDGAKYFDKPKGATVERCFRVIDVVQDNAALVMSKKNSLGDFHIGCTIYLLTNHNGHYYYDDEIINVPKDKNARQIGIFKYNTTSGQNKTVPIIEIMD